MRAGEADGQDVPTHEDFPWERDARRKRTRSGLLPKLSRSPRLNRNPYGRARGWRRGVTLIFLVVAHASALHLNLEGALGINAPNAAVPGAYVAVPGPWRWRWVRIRNPPPGTPRFVRQRYRTIKYVSATPVP